MRQRIVITGMGVCSALGTGVEQVAEGVAGAACGIVAREDVFPTAPAWAGFVPQQDSPTADSAEEMRGTDRTCLLAFMAAQQALQEAFPSPTSQPAPERIALLMGTSHGGRGQLDRFVDEGSNDQHADSARLVMVNALHYHQTNGVATRLGIRGPVATISNACSSSGAALGHAFELLQAGKVDLALAGGADAFSKLTYSGFVALGAMADGPCSPFSSKIGLSLGEGAAFLALETLEHARARRAPVHAELLGYGLSWDAHHITEPEPTGEGILRASHLAALMAGVRPEEVGYVHAHGTGTRANDIAECLALRRFFAGTEPIPPISSTKSATGHTLGASAVLGVILSLGGMKRNLLPATINFAAPRRGCDLDFIPNSPRPARVHTFLAQSAAFGGANAALIVGECSPTRPSAERPRDEVLITGVGLVSAIESSIDRFTENLRQGRPGIDRIVRFDTTTCQTKNAALVKEFDPRSLMPGIEWRRIDRVAKYAIIATQGALHDSRIALTSPERIGLVVGTSRGAATSFEKYLDSVRGKKWRNASPISFPNLVMSSIGGQVSKAFGLKGFASTVVGGITNGLHALSYGFELLRRNPTQDALVVVAADEIGALFYRLLGHLGVLETEQEGALRAYDPKAGGMVLGEGAVAVVLERASSVLARGGKAYARIAGYGLTSDAAGYDTVEPEGKWLVQAMEQALAEAGIGAADVDLVYGHGRGQPIHDAREVKAWRRLLEGRPTPIGCVLPNTGVAESACGLFSVAAALLSIHHQQAFPIASVGDLPADLHFVRGAPLSGLFRNVLVAGSTEHGNNAAVLLCRPNR